MSANNATNNMTTLIKDIYKLNPKMADRVLYLMNYAVCDKVFQDTMINYLRLVHIKRDPTKCKQLLEKIEQHLLKKSHFNFMIHSIPEYGILASSYKNEKIGYTHMYDTLEQFGKVDTLDIVRGTVYVKFAETSVSQYTHDILNNKMLGDQIVQTCVV